MSKRLSFVQLVGRHAFWAALAWNVILPLAFLAIGSFHNS